MESPTLFETLMAATRILSQPDTYNLGNLSIYADLFTHKLILFQ